MKSSTLLCAKDGSILAVNSRRLKEIPYFFGPNRPDTSITLAANQSSDPLSITVPGDGCAEVAALSVSSTGAFLARIELETPDGQKIPLSNGVIHSSNGFGNNTNPYWLPEPLRILNDHRLNVALTDISGASNVVRLAMHAASDTQETYDESGALYREIQNGITQIAFPYLMVLDDGAVTLTALQAIEKTVVLPEGCSFHLRDLTGTSTGTYKLNIFDANTGESLIDAPNGVNYALANNLIVGTGQYPFDLPFPRMFTKNQKIIVRITDTSNADNTVYLSINGKLVKDYVGRAV